MDIITPHPQSSLGLLKMLRLLMQQEINSGKNASGKNLIKRKMRQEKKSIKYSLGKGEDRGDLKGKKKCSLIYSILHTWKQNKTKTPHINMVMYANTGPVLKNKVNSALCGF